MFQVLLRRIQITHNKVLDGVLDQLNSKNMTSDGPLDLIDDHDSDEDGLKQSYKQLGYGLPGTKNNFGRPIARTKALQLCPTGRSFAAATTEGLLIYSIDDSLIFDPADIAIDVTPEVNWASFSLHIVFPRSNLLPVMAQGPVLVLSEFLV